MPKNSGKGGKKHRKQKNQTIVKREMIWKEQGQAYAIIEKMLGNGRVHLSYFTRDEDNCLKKNQALGIIRGTMRRKKIWIKIQDVVLVGIRDFEDGKVDILHKYDYDETKSLELNQEIPLIEELNPDKQEKQNNKEVVIKEDSNEIIFSNEVEFEENEEDYLANI
tara:strand:- start:1816 stop:2310 length:495 start_codon:yes stop_codon:yes gene_type:complete